MKPLIKRLRTDSWGLQSREHLTGFAQLLILPVEAAAHFTWMRLLPRCSTLCWVRDHQLGELMLQ